MEIKKTNTLKTKIILTILFCAVITVIASVLSENKDKSSEEIVQEKKLNKVAIETSKISNHLFSSAFSVPATLEPFESINVSFENSGIIKKLSFNLGDKIQKGQLIATLDNEIVNRQYQLNLINLEKTRNTYNKYKELNNNNNIPKIEFQNIEFELRTAEKQVAISKKLLSQSQIIAPISGIVTSKFFNNNDLVQAYSPIITISNNKKLKCILNLPYQDWANLNIGDNANATFSQNNETVLGKITKKIPSPSQSKNYPIEIVIANPAKLIPGLIVDINFDKSKNKELLAISRNAVIIKSNESFCYVLSNTKIELRKITTGVFDNEFIEIKSGISENETIISKGIQNVTLDTKFENLLISK